MKFGLAARLYLLVALFAVGCAALAVPLIWLHNDRTRARSEANLKWLTELATSVLETHRKMAAAGQMSEDEAKKRALSEIADMRYAGVNYFYVMTPQGVMVMNSAQPKLVGQSRMDVKDSRGRFYNRDMFAQVAAKGEGYNYFLAPKPGVQGEVAKTGYGKLYEPWQLVVHTGVYDDEIEAEQDEFLVRAAAIGIPLVLLLGGVVFLIARSTVRPLSAMQTAMTELAENRPISVTLDTARGDEIGHMARSVEVFRQAAEDKQRLEQEAASERAASEAMRTGTEAERLARAQEQAKVVSAIGGGLTQLAAGNLTYRLAESFPRDYEALRADFNVALDTLQATMRSVVGSAESIRSGTGEISQAADDLSRRTEQQAASLEETAAALDEITATVRKTAEGANHARDVVTTAKADAERSGEVVNGAVQAMAEIDKSSRQISSIIGVIDEIAFQTNLLALNAGVEAARAGEAGKGFAVVASEVRALAQRSADAAKEIKTLIQASSTQVGSGVDLVGQAGQALERIVAQISDLNAVVVEIAASAKEQATGLAEVNTAVNQMDQVTQQNAAMVEQSTAASRALAQEAAELGQLIGRFQVGAAAAGEDTSIRRGQAPAPTQRTKAARARPRSVGALALKSEPAEEGWEEF
jgi:methyl-accepting chemotaxis protein